MKKLITIFSLVILMSACCTDNKKHTGLYFYYRVWSSSSTEPGSYVDHLVMPNYKKNTFTIKQLSVIARKYIDTVSLPVGSVFIFGQPKSTCMPPADGDYYDEQKDFLVVIFGFDVNHPGKKLNWISIKNDADFTDYFEQKQIDSLLASPERLE